MRTSLVISVVTHAAILAAATLSFPSIKPYEVEPMKTVPVDIVDISDITKLKSGSKAAKPADQAKVAEKPAEKPPVKEQPKQEPPKKVAQLPPQPPKQPDAPKVATPAPTPPRPKPAEAKPEPKPTPEPAPKKAEPKPDETKVAAATPTPVPPVRPAHVPKPQPAKPAQPERKFDADKIAALLNKAPDRSAAAQPTETPIMAKADPGLGDPSGLDARMSVSEIDALRGQIARCWNPPIGVQGAEDLAVRIHLALNLDGTLAGPPELLSSGSGIAFQAAADSARRAVLRCQPYQLPPQKYETWRDINVNFDPREMLGG